MLSTARDIITLWVARMVIFGLFNRDDVPFRDVYIHPVIQDGNGKRMSKSAGNGVDPVDIIEIYGADALRYTLAAGATETQDLRIPVEKLKLPDGRTINTSERFEQGRNFANKFWNAARFAMMNLEGYEPAAIEVAALPVEDRWIIDGLDRTIAERDRRPRGVPVRRGVAAAPRLHLGRLLRLVRRVRQGPPARPGDAARRPSACWRRLLDGLCRLLHPIMPFVTEQVWQGLAGLAPSRGLPEPSPAEESVCIAAWPRPMGWSDEPAPADGRAVVRGDQGDPQPPRRAERPQGREDRADHRGARARSRRCSARGSAYIRSLSPAASVTIVDTAIDRPPDCAVAVLPEAEIILPLAGLIDKEAELAKHRKTLADLERQIGGHRSKLANESFVARAPAEVVEQARAKLAELEAQREAVLALTRWPSASRKGEAPPCLLADAGSDGASPSRTSRVTRE